LFSFNLLLSRVGASRLDRHAVLLERAVMPVERLATRVNERRRHFWITVVPTSRRSATRIHGLRLHRPKSGATPTNSGGDDTNGRRRSPTVLPWRVNAEQTISGSRGIIARPTVPQHAIVRTACAVTGRTSEVRVSLRAFASRMRFARVASTDAPTPVVARVIRLLNAMR
jgi:hypothetical protein